MPTYQFEAMDATGQEIQDQIEAATEEEAQSTIRQKGFFVTKISEKKARKTAATAAKIKRPGRTFAMGGVSSRVLTTFTRQLSILQDAGMPILRSIRILEGQCAPGRMKNSLMDVCDEIEGGATLSEAMGMSPKVFNRLYVNMIKAGEAGGALEIILQRLADFQERSESLKRQVRGAMIYPVMVVCVAVTILVFIMLWIVPRFEEIFNDFGSKLPAMTQLLIDVSGAIGTPLGLCVIPSVPIGIFLSIKLIRKFKTGRMGWDLFSLKVPVFGKLVEKNIMARTSRTLGTLVASGVPILEALTITRDTSGNAMFETMYGRVADSIRDGETISKPMKEYSRPGFHPVALFFWVAVVAGPFVPTLFFSGMATTMVPVIFAAGLVGGLIYFTRMNDRVVDDLVVNMVDVGEETGELDTMLYKVADTFDDEVQVITEGLTKLLEPLLIIFLGVAVGFIVIALFLPLISLITKMSSA